MKTFKFFLLSLLIFPGAVKGSSISRIDHDLSKSTLVKIGPGRISVLVFPESIAEAKIGAPDRLKVVTSNTDERELTLFWIANKAFRTNLIVRTVKRTFVFDIEPSRSGHQDLVQIGNVFGAPMRPALSKQLEERSATVRELYKAELK